MLNFLIILHPNLNEMKYDGIWLAINLSKSYFLNKKFIFIDIFLSKDSFNSLNFNSMYMPNIGTLQHLIIIDLIKKNNTKLTVSGW